MGTLIDLENMENIPRCEQAKLGVIIVNFIGVPSSFIILVICIIRMCYKKKRISFFTSIILFIFFFEVMNTVSKMLQLLKYAFEDSRTFKQNNDIETPRGIICQIQIVFSIFSDFGCLLGTLLLSFRCYEVIINKKRYLDSKKAQILSISLITFFSFGFAIMFLFIDRKMTHDSKAFKFDLRDRCNYWCWIEHTLSLICYSIYVIILVVNILYFCKIRSYLTKSYNNMKEKSIILITKSEEPKIENEINEQNYINSDPDTGEKQGISKEDRHRLNELHIMRMKFLVYPTVTITIWILSAAYRIIDDSCMGSIDEDDEKSDKSEKEYFKRNPGLQTFVQINLILHTILSSLRGTLYGYAFAFFNEKSFGNICRNCFYKCCYKKLDLIDIDEDDDQEKDPNVNSSLTDTNRIDNNEENQFRKSNNEYGKQNVDLNTSDYRYND